MSRKTLPITKLDAQGRQLPSSGDWTTFRASYYAGTSNIEYAGFARPGAAEDEAVWQLTYFEYDGDNLTSVKYPEDPDGLVSNEYIFVWDDRASYTFA